MARKNLNGDSYSSRGKSPKTWMNCGNDDMVRKGVAAEIEADT